MNRVLVWIVFLAAFSSCERDFIVPEQSAAKRMVLNSMFSDSWPITVYITASYASTGSNSITAVDDALVQLYEDGEYKETLNYFPSDTQGTFGAYRSVMIPQHGRKYLIKAQHPQYGEARAEDEIPLPAQIISYQLIQYPDTINHLHEAIVNFKFTDDGAKENFYRLNVWIDGLARFINANGDTIEHPVNYGLRTVLLTPVEDTIRDNGWFLLFGDKGFNGTQKEMSLLFPYTPYSSDMSSLRLWVEFYTVSKTHYEYYRTLQIAGNNNGNSEPVHVFSNVQNGYGIFAAEDFQTMEFVIK